MITNTVYCKYAAIVILLCVFISGNAQTLKGDFDRTNYPEISFVWNEYNPDIIDSTQFILSANGEKIPFTMRARLRDVARHVSTTDSMAKPKTILFLWEDLNHKQHAGQSDFTRNVLYNFLQNTVETWRATSLQQNADDKFNVAVFDRKGGNDLGSSIHTLLSNGFTSDGKLLAEAVRNYHPKYDFFSNQANSELYMAIEEGIEMLQKEPSDRIRAIVIFTAGSNQDSYGGRNSIDENRALSLKIPVYVVKYPIRGCEYCTNIDVICQKTYGLEITSNNAALASGLLKECYEKIAGRHYGQDYQISFTADYPRDGQQHAFVLNVGGKEYPLSFTAPAFSLKIWIKTHVRQSAIILFAILLILSLFILLFLWQTKRRKQKIAQLEKQQQATLQKAEENRQELESYKQQQEDDKKKNRKEEFARLMQTKNLLPRLQYNIGNERKSFTIVKPETTIGRDEDNDLVLLNDSISRHHAKITFNGSGFEIQDLGSTNKVIVNGAFVETWRATSQYAVPQRAETWHATSLQSGDIIGLGEVLIYFYN